MIKANELRIGNKLLHHGKVISVSGITDETDTYNDCFLIWYEGLAYNISEFNPIPLTSEIMQRCGFVRNGNYWDKGFFELPIYPKKDGSEFILVPNGKIAAIELKYLHQLQNLYFSLTSEELEIKELQSA